MNFHSVLAALPSLALVVTVSAAPPLSIPVPRPTPEQEALIAAEAEEARIREEIEEARRRLEADGVLADGSVADAPAAAEGLEAGPAPEAAPAPIAPFAPEAVPAPSVPHLPSAEGPEDGAPIGTPAPPDGSVRRDSLGVRPSETNAIFRRDPFWSVADTRARRADHDARVAAEAEAEARRKAIDAARQAAIERGADPDSIDEGDFMDLVPGSGSPNGASFSGATEEEWDAAFAKIPPRSGYLGGRKPALMLRGDKSPHYVGDQICVTNRGVVFSWRIASVDFRAYTHELERASASPLRPE